MVPARRRPPAPATPAPAISAVAGDAVRADPAAPIAADGSPKPDEPKKDKDEESAPKVDFSGNWNWSFTAPNGFVHEPTLRIKQSGSKLRGVIYGKRGGSLPVRDVRITKESKVAFTLDREFYGFPMEVKFIGKLEKNTIAGKMGVFVNGNSRVFDWTARRLRDDGRPVDPPGTPALAPPKL